MKITILYIGTLASRDIRFGSNSWRGDQYEPLLRQAIAGVNFELVLQGGCHE